MLQLIPLFQPLQITGQERGGEVDGIGQFLSPVLNQVVLQVFKADGAVFLHRLGEGGAKGGAVGPGGNEAGAMGGVLHGIGKGEQLFVAVEIRGKQRRAPGAGEAGGR